MNPSDRCRVDDCDRRAAASMIRDTLPGPLPLCATHTEDYRMNGAGWIIAWDQASPEPMSVKPAPAAAVGHSGPRPVEAPQPGSPTSGVKSRIAAWRTTRSPDGRR
jgi:hypothetical protein